MEMEKILLNKQRNVTLTAYLQGVGGEFSNIGKRPAVLVLPGGGYQFCSDREADPVALGYLYAGFQTFVLRYSIKEDACWPHPLEDAQQAMDLIRENAGKWNLYPDKLAVVGFSAGGHLAAACATLAQRRPNAAILGYPVTEMATAKGCDPTAPDLVSAVDEHTCPCFVFATRTDTLVPISNTVHFLDALDRYDISFESHIYSYGPHGFSVSNSGVNAPGLEITSRTSRWMADSVEWLKELFGDFGDNCLTEPKFGQHINGDWEERLSIDCTLGKLFSNPQAAKVLQFLTEKMPEGFAEAGLGGKFTLREVAGYGGIPEETLWELDEALRRIPNQ